MQRKKEEPIPDYCSCRRGRTAIGGTKCIGCGKPMGRHTRRDRRKSLRKGKDLNEKTQNLETDGRL